MKLWPEPGLAFGMAGVRCPTMSIAQGGTMTRKLQGPAILVAALLLAGAPAWAANGHLLHGVGAVNSAMGGAGVALPNDALGALNLNPALLTQLDGYTFELGAEDARAQNSVASQVG